jgi:hypothetical protein
MWSMDRTLEIIMDADESLTEEDREVLEFEMLRKPLGGGYKEKLLKKRREMRFGQQKRSAAQVAALKKFQAAGAAARAAEGGQ